MNELKNKQASDSASADTELTVPSGIAEPILQYMGLEINRNSLYRKDELVAILDKYGADIGEGGVLLELFGPHGAHTGGGHD